MATFQAQEHDGTLTSVSHKEFFEILNNSKNYLYYKRGGTHLALLPSISNESALRLCRQAENAENLIIAVESRCRDDKGQVCQYQHDEHGRIIRNNTGKPIKAKCGDCPRNGWTGGNRENCCIRNSCRTVDCTKIVSTLRTIR